MDKDYNDKWIEICVDTLIDKNSKDYLYRVKSLTYYLQNSPIRADAFFGEMINANRRWLG